jgi:hypothetical protein
MVSFPTFQIGNWAGKKGVKIAPTMAEKNRRIPELLGGFSLKGILARGLLNG